MMKSLIALTVLLSVPCGAAEFVAYHTRMNTPTAPVYADITDYSHLVKSYCPRLAAASLSTSTWMTARSYVSSPLRSFSTLVSCV